MAAPLDDRMRSALADLREGKGGAAVLERLHVDFAAYRPSVYRAARRLAGSNELAEDLTQQVMLVAWDKLASWRGESSFSTWLYGILTNVWRNRLRKREELLTADGVFEVGDPAVGVMSQLQRHEREGVFRRVCSEVLDAEEQMVVHLRYVRGLPRAELEQLIGLPSGKSRVVLQRCMRKLQQALRLELERLGHGTSFVRSTFGQ